MKMPQQGVQRNWVAREFVRFNQDPATASPFFKALHAMNKREFDAIARGHQANRDTRLSFSKKLMEKDVKITGLEVQVQTLVSQVEQANQSFSAKLSEIESQTAAIGKLKLELTALSASLGVKKLESDALKAARNAIMSRVGDVNGMMQTIVDETMEGFGFANAAILIDSSAVLEHSNHAAPAPEKEGLIVRAAAGYSKNIAGEVLERGTGISGWVFEKGEPMAVNDVSKDSRYVCREEGINSEMGVPLTIEGKTIGVLNVSGKKPGAFADPEITELIFGLAELASLGLSIAQKVDQLRFLAHHDELTGLYNRRYFFTDFQKRIEDARKRNVPLGMLVIDMDNFGEVNEVWGHKKGDEVLQLLAHIFTEPAKKFDPAPTIARMGGDEFAIMITLKNWDDEHKRWTDARELRREIKSAVKKLVDENKDALQNLEPKHSGVTKKVRLGVSVGMHDFGCEGNDGLHYTNLKTKVVVTDPEAFLTEQYTKPEGDSRYIKDKHRAEARKQ